jgi:hypothetical protein
VIEAVVVEVESPPEEVAAVEEVFRRAGFPVNVQRSSFAAPSEISPGSSTSRS